MRKLFRYVGMVWVLLSVGCVTGGGKAVKGSAGGGPVVLDIGHFAGGEGAQSPFVINGKRLKECEFWYQYSFEVKKEIEKAGYACVVTNRGNAPEHEPLASYARRAGVVHLRRPDRNGARYPSRYFPDRVGSGVVSADYAIYRKAACVVFLHHNSSGRPTRGASPSLILHNRYNGLPLARSLAHSLGAEVLNRGMNNGGRGCTTSVRYVDADRSASWMNACDDAGIPAAVIEAAFLNNRDHAEFLSTDAGARRYARAVAHGIINYMKTASAAPRHVRKNPNVADEGSFGYAAESRRLNVPGARILIRR